jgi:hypothetical protein
MERAKHKLDALRAWMDAQLQLVPGKSDLASAIRYARSRWQALTCYCADGRLEIEQRSRKRRQARKPWKEKPAVRRQRFRR